MKRYRPVSFRTLLPGHAPSSYPFSRRPAVPHLPKINRTPAHVSRQENLINQVEGPCRRIQKALGSRTEVSFEQMFMFLGLVYAPSDDLLEVIVQIGVT